MVTLRLPGQPVDDDPRDLLSIRELIDVQVLTTHEVIGVVRGAALRSADLEGAKDDDVVELQFEGDVSQWITVAQLRAEGRTDRGAEGDVLEIPVSYHRGTAVADRGVWDWVLRGLRVLRIDPQRKLADLGVEKIVDKLEGQQQPPPGLYRVDEKGALTEAIKDAGQLAGGLAPWLVFIHGTASSTDGSFGKLFDKPEWQQLRTKYGDRVLALQHKSLSASPTTNAIDLASLLPSKAVLDLVTHSRGGLVGELLCLGDFAGFDEAVQSSFGGRAKDIADLKNLGKILKKKQFTVEKFVRVACPARGTILASRRLDIYFSVILNLLGHVMPDNPIYALFKATALELIRRRTNPDELPGLEAMMPESPLVHFLNKGLSSNADLGVIAGDLQGDTLSSRLKAFATDIFYLQEHDLVVNTSAMFGGMGRPQGAYGFYDQGAKVNHFSYFENEKTRKRLYGWLIEKPRTFDPEFKKFDPAIAGIPIEATRAAAAADVKTPALILVPDVFATILMRGDEELWPNVRSIARHGLASLAIDAQVRVGQLVDRVYGPLAQTLSTSNVIIPFPYDWRRSLDETVTALDELLKTLRDRTVHIIAHGTGGMVTRAWMAQKKPSWKGQMLFLGVPADGIFAAVQWMSGRSKLARMLALAGGRAGPDLADGAPAKVVGEWFRSLPGIVQLVPSRYLDVTAWRPLGVAPDRDLLAEARRIREQIAAAGISGSVRAIVGRDAVTPVEFTDDPQQVRSTRDGDGRVPYAEAVAPGEASWRADVPHGELPSYAGAFPAYFDLLRGSVPSALQRAQSESSSVSIADSDAAQPLLFPTSEDLATEAFALGRKRLEVEDYPLNVSVKHGDLRTVQYPVAVGHYLGDSIVSAEKVLDRQLDGRLSRRFQMGLYPAQAGAVDVIMSDPHGCPPGAIIIGLGEIDKVTPEVIRRGIATAALRYALRVAEEAKGKREQTSKDPASWLPAAFSAVLIGTNGGNAITIEESITAIIRGTVDANRTLRRHDQWKYVRINAIELIELYEVRAVESVYAAQSAVERLRGELEPGERIDVATTLHTTESGQFRTPPSARQTGWWQRMTISAERSGLPEGTPDDDAPLEFVVITERARAEAMLQCREQNITRMLVNEAVTNAYFDARVSGALFELLIPIEIKSAASLVPNVVLNLDRAAARIPWEILADRTSPDNKPFSVRAGLLRQLKSRDYRVDPRAAELRTAFVVGDTTSGLRELKGAQEEAAAVQKVVSDSFTVTALQRPRPLALITELFARPYRIIHLAGHGIYNAARPEESGMVLDATQAMYLTACQFRQMRTVPDFVFINCCHLGTLDTEARPHLLAASVAEELIDIGVKAVVAAGWAVDDRAAVTFASALYGGMLQKRLPFGEAVRQARQEVFTRHPTTNTWAAYQCYGNPGFMLADIDSAAPAPETQTFCTKREYIDAIRSLRAQATASEDRARVLESLVATTGHIPPEWRDGETLAELGYTWQSLGDYAQAISHFEEGLLDEEGHATIHAVEQLWNMLVRHAMSIHGEGAVQEEIDKLLSRARELKKCLTPLPSTRERMALKASELKKLAGIASDPNESNRLLEESAEAYLASSELNKKTGEPAQYPLLNYIIVKWFATPKREKYLLERLDQIESDVNAAAVGQSFWSRVGPADLALTRALLSHRLGKDADDVFEAYKHAANQGAAQSQTQSVIEHVDWVASLLDRRRRPAETRAAQDLLKRLKVLWPRIDP